MGGGSLQLLSCRGSPRFTLALVVLALVVLALVVLALAVLALVGCSPSYYADIPFACSAGICPEGYVCGADRLCHRPGARDLGQQPDLGRQPDLRVSWPEARPLYDQRARDQHVTVADLPRDSAAGPLFYDDFSQPGGLSDDGWGVWTVAGGVLTQSKCPTYPDAIIAGKSWTNVKVSAKVRVNAVCPLSPEVASVGLTVRATNGPNCENKQYYICMIDILPSGGYLWIFKQTPANCKSPTEPTSTVTPTLALNTWYSMTLSASGNVITCTLSGGGLAATTVTFTDPAAALGAGSAGVGTSNAAASFDDLLVQQL